MMDIKMLLKTWQWRKNIVMFAARKGVGGASVTGAQQGQHHEIGDFWPCLKWRDLPDCSAEAGRQGGLFFYAPGFPPRKKHEAVRGGRWENIAVALARQLAVKRGTPLSEKEICYLASRLFSGIQPEFSPSGKKVFRILSEKELDSLFGTAWIAAYNRIEKDGRKATIATISCNNANKQNESHNSQSSRN